MLLGYARVSTDDQNLEPQIDQLIAAGVDPSNIYQEHVSGAKTKRPELQNLMRAMRDGDILVICKLDRLGRSTMDLLKIADQLKERGIELRSLSDCIDTTTPAGKLLYTMLAAFAEFERNLISERTKAGLKAARARGARGGRPPTLKVKQVETAIKFLRDPTVTHREVAEMYGVHQTTLRRAIDRYNNPAKLADLKKLESTIARNRTRH